MASMRLGGVISFLGAITALAPIIYYITLPLDSPTRVLLSTPLLGLIPYIFCFTIAGGAITALGLAIFIKAARTAEMSIAPRAAARIAVRMPEEVEAAPPPRAPRRAREGEKRQNLISEIEQEIEAIVRSKEAPVGVEGVGRPEEKVEEAPGIEVVTTGSDVVCPHCGGLNEIGSTECAKCGNTLFTREGDEPACPVCGAPLRLARSISDELFVCGLCFSELKISRRLQEIVGLRR